MNLYMTVGVVGSGKSTFAKNWVLGGKRTVIDVDGIRSALHGGIYTYNEEHEDYVFRTGVKAASQFLSGGYEVLMDDASLFLTKDGRMRFINACLCQFGIEKQINFGYYIFQTPSKDRVMARRAVESRGLSVDVWAGVYDKHIEMLQVPESSEGIIIKV